MLIEKSTTPLTGENVLTCFEDFDLNLYDVIVGYVNDKNEILKHTKLIRNNELLLREIENLRKIVNPQINYDTCTLEELKEWYINLSKQKLKEYLENNPIFSTCHDPNGAYYSITEEKQQYLSQMIIITQLALQNGIDFQPSWNATGEPCTYDWTLEQLQQLAFEIERTVRPLVTKQQEIESKIQKANSKEEVLRITIEY